MKGTEILSEVTGAIPTCRYNRCAWCEPDGDWGNEGSHSAPRSSENPPITVDDPNGGLPRGADQSCMDVDVTKRERLDQKLVMLGLAESRTTAQRLVMARQVRVNGEVADKSSRAVGPDDDLTVDAQPRFVSRGGDKLAAALAAFLVPVAGRVCADVGASTGGFTDCLLQAGAERVYAIDVGHGILHWRLRTDPRVVVMERTNARHLESLPEPIGLATVDAAFISLRLLLPAMVGWLEPDGEVVALVKPQFEAGRSLVGRGGVVKDLEVHRSVLTEVIEASAGLGLKARGLIRSPLIGPKGNVEFLLWASRTGPAIPAQELLSLVFPA